MKRLFFIPLLTASVAFPEPTSIDRAFDRMYRRDFAGAQSLLAEHIGQHPADPLGYSVRASAHLFSELDRLSILESEFFGDDDKILTKKKLTPDPVVRSGVFDSIEKARQTAAEALKRDAKDRNALFALCIATGVQTDYLALIEKRQLGSLTFAKESQRWALKLLESDSTYYDAYLTTGLSEYLLGSVPFFVRWFVKFDKTEGSKSQAVRNLELVAKNGRYLRPFSKVLLAVIHLREKRLQAAEMYLAELARDFPENPLYGKELTKIRNRRSLVPGR